MIKTLRITFSLRNTYRVNGILYSLKQIPFVGKLFPELLYQIKGLKIFANILSVIWEVISAFLGKLLYFLLLISGIASFYKIANQGMLFLHILVFLTVIGAFANTYMFNPSRDKYYALILLRMDARKYTLVNYGYSILKVMAGFLLSALIFGLSSGLKLWQCFLIPFFVAGSKLTVAACAIRKYEKTGIAANENVLGKYGWLAVFLLLGAAYGLPLAGILIPEEAVIVVMAVPIFTGSLSVFRILGFREYYQVYQQILAQSVHQMETAQELARTETQKKISADTGITSSRKGFEYFNELFIKRHQKILWRSSKRIAAVCLCLIGAVMFALYLRPEIKTSVNGLMLSSLPVLVFVMYLINRGTGFTRVLFINCDHSLLTYSFYKRPRFILKLFKIRLREIIKVNLLPAAVIGAGLTLLLYASGGTDNFLNYIIMFLSVLSMSIFFSVHYLTIYYLLQPYNEETEMKSGTYQIILSATYLVCFFVMKLKLPNLIFGVMVTLFCVIYCMTACALVYYLAPKTFRLRK